MTQKDDAGEPADDWTDDPYELVRLAGRELRTQFEQHPYVTLAAAAGLGVLLGGGAMTRWVAAGAALALREGARWAAREGLRRIVEAPSPAAFSGARDVPRERTPHH